MSRILNRDTVEAWKGRSVFAETRASIAGVTGRARTRVWIAAERSQDIKMTQPLKNRKAEVRSCTSDD